MTRLLRWTPALAMMAILFVLSHQPSLPSPSIPYIDKLEHALAYALLAITYGFALAPGEGRRTLVAVVALTALYGAFDELHQSMVAGRHASLADWFADLVGGGLGAALLSRPPFAALLGLWENSHR